MAASAIRLASLLIDVVRVRRMKGEMFEVFMKQLLVYRALHVVEVLKHGFIHSRYRAGEDGEARKKKGAVRLFGF